MAIAYEEIAEIFCRTTRRLMLTGLSEEDAKAKAKEILSQAANVMAEDVGHTGRIDGNGDPL